MLNNLVLVGRLKEIIKNDENEITIVLETTRSFKNLKGEYDVDVITCSVNGNLSRPTLEYCKPGDVIGVKGRIQTINNEMKIVAEKITFLSNRKEDE